jgi:hypothetical protein
MWYLRNGKISLKKVSELWNSLYSGILDAEKGKYDITKTS